MQNMPRMGLLPGEESFLVCCLQIEIYAWLAALGVANNFPPLPRSPKFKLLHLDITKVFETSFLAGTWTCVNLNDINRPRKSISNGVTLHQNKARFHLFRLSEWLSLRSFAGYVYQRSPLPKAVRSLNKVCGPGSLQKQFLVKVSLSEHVALKLGINISQRSSVMDLLEAITDLKGNGCNADNTCNTVQSLHEMMERTASYFQANFQFCPPIDDSEAKPGRMHDALH